MHQAIGHAFWIVLQPVFRSEVDGPIALGLDGTRHTKGEIPKLGFGFDHARHLQGHLP
jgi:hypothetical protein